MQVATDIINKITIDVSEKDNKEYYSCYVPHYDIHFSCKKSKGENEIKKKARVLVSVLINALVEINNER